MIDFSPLEIENYKNHQKWEEEIRSLEFEIQRTREPYWKKDRRKELIT